jgi:hypothetical protein
VSWMSGLETTRSTIERGSRHTEIPSDLRGRLATIDESDSATNLAVRNALRTTSKVLAGGTALTDRVDNSFALDLVFHLRERRHDRKQHGPHRSRGVDVAAAEIEHSKAGAASAQFVRERQHVLRRTPKPVQSRDHQGVPLLQRVERPVELGPGSPCAGDTVVDVQVIATDPCGEKIDLLTIHRLLSRRHPRVSDQL